MEGGGRGGVEGGRVEGGEEWREEEWREGRRGGRGGVEGGEGDKDDWEGKVWEVKGMKGRHCR